jgi:hypothetical protein
MSEYAITIPEPNFQYTDETIFYADRLLTIFRDGPYVLAVDNAGEQIQKIRCPSNFKNFESVDLGDAVLLMFSGEQIVILDKTGIDIIAYALETNRMGSCITPMKLSKDASSVVFGTRNRGHIQFVNYDYSNRIRISQTASYKMAEINDFDVSNDIFYALLDNSYLISANISTCESLWHRFETGRITPKLIPSKNEVYYACGGVLKYRNPDVVSIKIPLVKVNSVEAKFGNHIIITGMNGLSLCCYDIANEELKWQIRSNLVIQQTLPVKILVGGKANDAVIVMTKDHITIVDCTKGRNVYHTEFKNIARIRRTGSHILLHKYSGSAGVIAGELL